MQQDLPPGMLDALNQAASVENGQNQQQNGQQNQQQQPVQQQPFDLNQAVQQFTQQQNFQQPQPQYQQPQYQQPQYQQPQQQNQAPYQGYLNQVPEVVRPQVEQVFKKWDQDVTKRFEGIHSQYQPYQELIQQYDPDTLAQAIAFAQQAQENPRAIYDAIGSTYGYNSPQVGNLQQGAPQYQQPQYQQPQYQQYQQPQQYQQQYQQPEYNEYTEFPPQFMNQFNQMLQGQQQQQQLLTLLGQAIVQQQQEREAEQQQRVEAENMQHFDTLLGDLAKRHGEFDTKYVLANVLSGMEPEAAVIDFRTKYGNLMNQQRTNQTSPVVMGSGGGMPTNQIDATKLSDKDVKDLVSGILNSANTNG